MSALLLLALLILAVLLADTRARLKRAEKTLAEAAKRIGALQRHTGILPPALPAESEAPAPPPPPAPESAAPRTERRKTRAVAASIAPLATIAGDEPAPPPSPPPPARGAEAPPPQGFAARFENLFGKTLPIWAGGITLAIAGVLIVKYAIDLGLFARVFTPPVQIAAGLVFGLALIGGAEIAWRHEEKLRDARVPQALAGAGVATLYAAILVAANVYALIGPVAAFLGLALVTAAALGLSLRFGPPSALLGLAGGLAAPALVGAVEPNVPLLSTYLALTVAGLTGVSRKRHWPWLALAALAGGAGWSLWLVLAGDAVDVLGSLSAGGLILLLAIGLPGLALEGPRTAMLRAAAAIVGALQLALLVAAGGFALLHWGLFALIAAAAQWLAWRERGFAIVPTVSAALSILLLALWPDPPPGAFALIALALAAIHLLPLLARLWAVPAACQRAVEIALIALAAPPLVKVQFLAIADAWLALIALAAALIPAAGLASGWRVKDRAGDARFAILAAAAALLIAFAAALLVPLWAAPCAVAVVAAALLLFGQAAADRRIEPVAALFLLAAIALLGVTAPHPLDEALRLAGGDAAANAIALLRWAAISLAALLFAVRAIHPLLRRAASFAAAALAYGALAQIVPGGWLMLVPAAGGAACLLAMRRVPPARIDAAAIAFAMLSLGWAALPVLLWSGAAAISLAGVPMAARAVAAGIDDALLRLVVPALLIGGAVLAIRARLPHHTPTIALALAGAIGAIGLHILYRFGFAALFGSDFIATGVAQRLVWQALLIGGGWLALRRGLRLAAVPLLAAGTLHAIWYGLVLHNPLWAEQAVGSWPLLNLLAPLFALPAIGLLLLARLAPPRFDRVVQIAAMLLIAAFAWATLRQAFHGSLLVAPGVTASENILRSLLLLLLAIAYLLWGIRSGRHDWRIASLVLMLVAVGKVFLFDASGLEGLLRIGSFIALGFSLIGIGWLYSRQLAGGDEAMAGDTANSP